MVKKLVIYLLQALDWSDPNL